MTYETDLIRIVDLLKLAALGHAEQEQPEEALAEVQALLHAVRAMGDEPSLRAQQLRSLSQSSVARTLERVLAQGEASAERLAALQQVLAAEDGAAIMQIAARADRARVQEVMQAEGPAKPG